MTDDKSLVPKLRFPGFTGAWERRKLGGLVDVRSGQDYKHLSAGDIPVYGTGGYMLSVNQALSYSEDAIGIGRKGTIDKPYILHAPFWTVDTLFYAVPKDGNELDFLHFIFERINWKREDESTGVPSLSKKTINGIKIQIPVLKEQRQIGAFFKQLDDLIALYQRKLSHLEQLKKGLLQKMFPKPGESYPEIRFPGFTGAWQQRKLGNMLIDSGTGKSSYNLYRRSTKNRYPVLGSTSILGYDSEFDYEGDFVLTARVGANAGTLFRYSGKAKITDNTIYLQSDNPIFVEELLNHINISRLSFGTGQPLIKASELKKLSMAIPRSLSEIEMIQTLFKNLGKAIALHQHKLSHLQQLKKALLQQMFV